MNKYKKLLIVVVTLFPASATYAQIGDFELSDDGWYDHPATAANNWVPVYVDDPLVMPSKYEFSNDWHTCGDVSLRANVTGWNWFMGRDIHTYFWDNSKIEFDIYAVAQEGSSATWAQIEQIAFSTQTNGWFGLAGAQFNIGLGGSGTHCVLDYSAYKTSQYASPTDTYESIIFALNSDGPVYLYIDNVIIPEPATVTLFGFGGLALLRRRK
jgi:hypothetical protein